jgi:general stress protein CsbA
MSVVIAIVAGILTFTILAALALPRLETSLTFLPIFAFSVLVGFVASKVYERRKKSN